MKLKLNPRKHIEKDIGEDSPVIIKYFAKTGKQEKEQKKIIKSKDKTMMDFNELMENQFWENIEASTDVIKAMKTHFDDNGGLTDFINECDSELGKLKSNE